MSKLEAGRDVTDAVLRVGGRQPGFNFSFCCKNITETLTMPQGKHLKGVQKKVISRNKVKKSKQAKVGGKYST